MSVLLEGGEPFLFRRGKTGCLLIHGFTGAPREMRWMGEQLAEHGYTSLGVRLFGHGTEVADLRRARWRDWLHSVEDGYHWLTGLCDRVFLIGLSLGASLSLTFGADHPVGGIVALSTPYQVPDSRVPRLRPLIPLISLFWRFAAKGEASWQDPERAKDHLDYLVYPVRASAELHDLLVHMRRSLPRISVPVLLIHSRQDESVPSEHPKRLLHRLTTQDKDLLWVEQSGHVITRDAAREDVLAATLAFMGRLAAR